MSFTTGTNAELIYVNRTSATAVTTFTAEQTIIPGITEGSTGFAIPANFLTVGKALRIVLSGVWGATATPSLTWTLRLNTTGGALVATTTALPLTAITNTGWRAEMEMVCTATGPGTTGQARATGTLWTRTTAIGATTASQVIEFCGGSAAGTPTPATPTLLTGFDTTINNLLIPAAIFTVSSASNSITLTTAKLWGVN